MKKYKCKVCEYVYDPAKGDEDLPDDWLCPLCGATKEEFVEDDGKK